MAKNAYRWQLITTLVVYYDENVSILWDLSVLVVEIGEKTCDRFKGYVSRHLKLTSVNIIVIHHCDHCRPDTC